MKTTLAKYGDRWDLLAYDIYGDSSRVQELLKANSNHVDINNPIITEGTTIFIPDVYVEKNKTTKTLAPWKR